MNMNDINATGIYTLAGNWTNSPRGADSFVATGLLLHMHRRHNAGPISWQLCVLQTYENIVFYRFNNGGYWSTWFKMAQDDEVVHKTGDEEIAGQKTLQNRLVFKTVNDVLKIIHPSMDGTTIPDTSLFSHISFFDKNDNRQAFIQLADRPNGNLELELVLNNGSSDVVKDERIKLGYNKSTKSFYTVAPTPVTESNDNSIATTKWVRDLLLSAVPTGTILPFAGKTVPSGFLSCNKANVSRTTYAKLFSIIGTTYGSGDGSTTFTLPDYRNRFVMGANTASEVGTYLESGAPNITGWHGGHAYKSYDHNETGGAFYGMDEKHGGAGATTNCDVWKMGFDASLSNPIYGRSSEIQPPSGKALWIIKF